MMTKKSLISILLMLSCLFLWAQTGLPVYDRLVQQRTSFPLERVYVQTDAEDYLQGDRIWLKAYLMDEIDHTPVDSTLYLYAELFDTNGDRVQRIKLLRRQGAFYGYLDIPEDMLPGEAWLRTYSRYMAAAPEAAFVKRLMVGRGKGTDPSDPNKGSGLDLVRRPHGYQIRLNSYDPCYLLVLRGGEICYLGGIGRGKSVSIPDDALPDGPLEFLAVDREGQVVTRRNEVLDRGEGRFRLPVRPDKRDYMTGDTVRLQLDVSSLREGEMLDLSVAVTCRPLMRRHLPASIVDYVQGRPSGFDYAEALRGKIRQPGSKEVTASLSGSVETEFLGRPVKDARIGLISPDVGLLDVRQSDAGGRFRFDGLDFPAGTKYLVKSTDQKGRDRYRLLVDEETPPPFRIPENPYVTAVDDTLHVIYADDESVFGTLALDAATVSLTVDGPPPVGINRSADFAITLRKIEERGYNTLEELLREVPSVFIREGRAYIRGAISIYADTPAAIAVDGTILDGEYDLDVIRMPDVARVDVFKTGQTVIWGPKGGAGVISVTTKAGILDQELLRGGETVHTRVVPLGYQPASDFQSVPIKRRTVYWNPFLLSDSVSFRLGDFPGACLVVLEGVTSDGRLVHEECTFDVSR